MIDIPNNINNKLEDLKFVDLFAGIGGFHLALKSFNAKCVFASEWDKHASATYYNNFKIKPYGDITQIDETKIPPHDILCAGFPCQAFSVSGKQKGFEDTRGTLFFDIVRIVNFHQPKILFLENVKNLLKHDNGNTFKVIRRTLEKTGYTVFYKVLNAGEYGLPQNRERIYIVAFHKNLGRIFFNFPKKINEETSLESILEENSDMKIIEREDIVFYKEYNIQKDLFNNIKLPNKPIQIGRVNKGGQGERIYHILGHAITLSAHGGGVGAKTGLYHVNNKVRRLSTRECARLQGFPESFEIISSESQSYKQFGNSVPVNVLQHILIEINNTLNNINERKAKVRFQNS